MQNRACEPIVDLAMSRDRLFALAIAISKCTPIGVQVSIRTCFHARQNLSDRADWKIFYRWWSNPAPEPAPQPDAKDLLSFA
jgi:hypothetical protein